MLPMIVNKCATLYLWLSVDRVVEKFTLKAKVKPSLESKRMSMLPCLARAAY